MPQAALLENVLSFTTAPVILHVSANSLSSAYTGARLAEQLESLQQHPARLTRVLANSLAQRLQANGSRVIFNPTRLFVSKHGPGILAAHLSNFALCTASRMPCSRHAGSDVRFVLLSSNQVLFRHGLEDWVAAHSMAHCLGDRCTDFSHGKTLWNASVHGLERWRTELSRLSWQRVTELQQLAGAHSGIYDTGPWVPSALALGNAPEACLLLAPRLHALMVSWNHRLMTVCAISTSAGTQRRWARRAHADDQVATLVARQSRLIRK